MRSGVRRGRPAVGAAARLRAPRRPAGHGGGGRARRLRARHPDLRSRHRHRQDARVPRSRRRRGRADRGLHRHPPSPGPAARTRSAARVPRRRARSANRLAQGPIELPLPLALRAGADLRAVVPAAGGGTGGASVRLGRPHRERRPRGGDGPRRERSGTAGRHLHGGQLPRLEVPDVRRMPRRGGAPPGRRGGRGGCQPPPPVRGHDAEGTGIRGAAPVRRYPDHRRGAPDPGRRDPVSSGWRSRAASSPSSRATPLRR